MESAKREWRSWKNCPRRVANESLNFGNASEENIREGIKRLGKVLKKILGTNEAV
jgi:DNA-binding transcriptional MocR family regulator